LLQISSEEFFMAQNILMPALSPTMTEGTLAKWLKKEGDKIKSGDVIAEIETDKATMEVEAADEGVLGKILIGAGTGNVAVNTPIAVLLEDGEDLTSIQLNAPVAQAPSAMAKAENIPPTSASQNKPQPPLSSAGSRVFATPLARRLAAQKNIDLLSIKGSGPHGRIVKADIDTAKAGSSVAPQQVSSSASSVMASGPNAKTLATQLGMSFTETPNSSIRKVIAKRLLESKQTVPHFYLTVECNLDELLSARVLLNEQAKGAYKLSVNDFVIKAVAMALKAYPAANVAWTDEAILNYQHADISVAVATPNGLITPIIKKAETKGLKDISSEMKDLAARARDGKLKPEEFQGGTFSISNLGMYGVQEFGAIINPPQACILAVGAGVEKPIVKNGKIEIATMMNCTLSVDHRAVDGAVGAEFLQYFKSYIENPVSMLV
jgi:pyruvate dehydrogenase E2 component (dihydrolipoamide acetyltransferase)